MTKKIHRVQLEPGQACIRKGWLYLHADDYKEAKIVTDQRGRVRVDVSLNGILYLSSFLPSDQWYTLQLTKVHQTKDIVKVNVSPSLNHLNIAPEDVIDGLCSILGSGVITIRIPKTETT